ncbi:MAG: hypothetical protein MJ152_03965 [Clostridia bacterium]|nr:hypothetical protein [Clostridia bacterium]
MFTKFESEALIKVYGKLQKRCDLIDKFIKNHALYFGPCSSEYGAEDVYNNILDLIARKNRLINLKVIMDSAIKNLKDADKQVIFIKMKYNISMAELCGVLELKERTAFRRVEQAFIHLAEALTNSKYCSKPKEIINEEDWILSLCDEVKTRRLAYVETEECVVNSL